MRTPADRAHRASSRKYPSVRESLACRSCQTAYCRIATPGIPPPRVTSPHGAQAQSDSLVVADVLSSLPAAPEPVAAFLAFEARRGVKSATIGRRLAALRYVHTLSAQISPTEDERVLATMRGIRRSHGTAPLRKAPATADVIIAMAPIARQRLADVRDRALLLIGFAGAFRRSELVALN